MHDIMEHLTQTSITIELDDSLAQFTGASAQADALKTGVLSYARDLAADLTLPVDITLEITLTGDTATKDPALAYVVRVNGKRCRVVFPTKVPENVSAGELARSITQAMHQNRELFITTPLCEMMQQRWLAEQGTGNETPRNPAVGVPELQKLCALLARRGFKIERIKEHFKNFEETFRIHRSVDYLFETVIGSWDSISLTVYLSKEEYRAALSASLPIKDISERIQDTLFRELGVMSPTIVVLEDETLGEYELRVRLNDVQLPPVQLSKDRVRTTLEESLLDIARRHAGSFLVSDAVTYMLSVLRKSFDALVQATLALFDEKQLASICRSLVDEGISIKDLRSILEGLTSVNGTMNVDMNKDVVLTPGTANFYPVAVGRSATPFEDLETDDYANCIRMSLKRYIASKYYVQEDIAPYAFLLDPQTEERMKRVEAQPLDDEEYMHLMQGIFHALKSIPDTVANPVILTDEEIRMNLRKQIEKEFPQVAVLSNLELLPGINFTHVYQISMASAVSAA
jgi:FHIPEP family